MTWIDSQPYYKVEREVQCAEQKTVVHNRIMYLYHDKIVTRHRTFPIEGVFDISYRHIGGSEGFLYLHTKRGVYSYTLNASPEKFIQSFKELRIKL